MNADICQIVPNAERSAGSVPTFMLTMRPKLARSDESVLPLARSPNTRTPVGVPSGLNPGTGGGGRTTGGGKTSGGGKTTGGGGRTTGGGGRTTGGGGSGITSPPDFTPAGRIGAVGVGSRVRFWLTRLVTASGCGSPPPWPKVARVVPSTLSFAAFCPSPTLCPCTRRPDAALCAWPGVMVPKLGSWLPVPLAKVLGPTARVRPLRK